MPGTLPETDSGHLQDGNQLLGVKQSEAEVRKLCFKVRLSGLTRMTQKWQDLVIFCVGLKCFEHFRAVPW